MFAEMTSSDVIKNYAREICIRKTGIAETIGSQEIARCADE